MFTSDTLKIASFNTKIDKLLLKLATISAAIAVLESQNQRQQPTFRPDNSLPTYDDVVNYEKEKEAAGIEPPTYEEALKMIGVATSPSQANSGLRRTDNPSGLSRQDQPVFVRLDSAVLPNVPESRHLNQITNPMANPANSPITNPMANPANNPIINPMANPANNPITNPANPLFHPIRNLTEARI